MPDNHSRVPWPQGSVLYQIYLRSFFDSDGDGVGDLQGVASKLDYLSDLGVDALWLTPFYPSPMDDLGYDITDYCGVDPIFGNLDDFHQLVQGVHRRGMRLLVDFVPNHTSTQHPWFLDSKASRQSLRRNWYVWRDGKPNGEPPNNWQSAFGGSAWQYDPASGQYYLHSFLPTQADLNWANSEVRRAMAEVMRFWLDAGVDGFRVDSVNFLSKDQDYRDDPPNPVYGANEPGLAGHELLPLHSNLGPDTFTYLREISEVLLEYKDRFMLTEAYATDGEAPEVYYEKFYQRIDPTVCAPFNFDAIFRPWNAGQFSDFIAAFQRQLRPGDIPVYCFGNHDQQRMASRLTSTQLRTAAVLSQTLPGLAVLYYGDEIGIRDGRLTTGGRRSQLDVSRYAARTPMQWSPGHNAGFTTGKAWLPVSSNYLAVNVENELADRDSLLTLYRRLLRLRRESLPLQQGGYERLEVENPAILAFRRDCDGKALAVFLNFSGKSQPFRTDLNGSVVLSTHSRVPAFSGVGRLDPNEGVVVWLRVA